MLSSSLHIQSRRTLTGVLFRDPSASCADLFLWWNAPCCCKHPSLAASACPSHPCSVSSRLSTWIPVCDSASRLGLRLRVISVEWACATCDLFINSFVRSPTNALPLSDWNVMGHPCLAIPHIYQMIACFFCRCCYARCCLRILRKMVDHYQHLIIAVAVIQIF